MSNIVATQSLSSSEIDLIKATVAKGASDIELKLFLERCARMGLDPLKPGQIHFVKYGNSPGTIIIGREGFRSRAGQTGKHSGTKLGVLRAEDGRCIGAWCEVYRSDWDHPAREEVSLSEYNTQKAQWLKMPETMIKKVAECAALRMAFPDELGGVYSKEEMDQADESREVTSSTPLSPAEFIVNLGKRYKGMRLAEMKVFEITEYMKWIKFEADENFRTHANVQEFLAAADAYLKSSSPPEESEEWEVEPSLYDIAKGMK